ncbi:MAG: hypothetical protein ACRDPA_07275, partial [Solirubrobacteraceae bacterium]
MSAALNIPPVEINATINFNSSGQATGTGSIFLGNGPAFISSSATTPDNPNAEGVYLSGATFALYKAPNNGGYALWATGTVGVVGIAGVAFSGTVTIEWNTTGSAYTGFSGETVGTVMLPSSIAAQALPSVGASNLSLGLPGGISLSGGIDFSQSATSGFQFDFGATSQSGTNATLTIPGLTLGVSGFITVSSAGVVGLLTVRGPSISVSGVTMTPTSISLGVNTTSSDVPATSTTPDLPANSVEVNVDGSISAFGQSISGDFVFQQVQGQLAPGAPAGSTPPEVTLIAMTMVQMSIGTNACSTSGAGVCVNGASGTLLLTGNGLAGQLSGGVTFNGLGTGASFTGNFSIEVNTTNAAVTKQFTVLGTSVAINVPAGPFFQIEGTGVQFSLDGQSLSGDFQFTQGTIGSSTSITEI